MCTIAACPTSTWESSRTRDEELLDVLAVAGHTWEVTEAVVQRGPMSPSVIDGRVRVELKVHAGLRGLGRAPRVIRAEERVRVEL